MRRSIFPDIVFLSELIWQKCPDQARRLQVVDDAIRWQRELVAINLRRSRDNRTEETRYVESVVKLHNLLRRKTVEAQDKEVDQLAESLMDEIKKYMRLEEMEGDDK